MESASFVFSMTPFGLVMIGGLLIALGLGVLRAGRFRLTAGNWLLFGALAVPLCLLTARGCFFLASLDWIEDAFWALGKSGYMLYGAIIGGMLAAFAASRITRKPFGDFMDAAAAPAALMIAVGRGCEYFLGTGYGAAIEEWFNGLDGMSLITWEDPSALYRFPFAMQDYYEDWCFAINLPEMLWAAAIVVILLCMQKRKRGGEATMMLLLYAAGQIVLETMREDFVMSWSFVKINQLLSAIAVLLILVLCWWKTGKRRTLKELLIPAGLLVVCAGIVMLMEFTWDKKIAFLDWMTVDLIYAVDVICCVGMILIVRPVWRRAFPKA